MLFSLRTLNSSRLISRFPVPAAAPIILRGFNLYAPTRPGDNKACQADGDCDTAGGEICCPTKNVCEVPPDATNPAACGRLLSVLSRSKADATRQNHDL